MYKRQLTARATDNQGATTTSAVATVTIGTDIMLQAEGYAAKNAMIDGGALMGGAGNGSWLRFDNVPLGSAAYVRFSVSYQGNADTGVPISVHQGSVGGTVLASLNTGAANGSAFVTQSTAFTSPVTSQTLYVVFGGGNGAAYYDWFRIDTPVPGDANGDTRVDAQDLTLVNDQLGRRSTDSGWDSRADLNGDGRVDATDLNLVVRNQGP